MDPYTHTHPRLESNIIDYVVFKNIETVQSGDSTLVEGIKKGTTIDNRIFYLFESDDFQTDTLYKSLTKFNFSIPENFSEDQLTEQVEFVSKYLMTA